MRLKHRLTDPPPSLQGDAKGTGRALVDAVAAGCVPLLLGSLSPPHGKVFMDWKKRCEDVYPSIHISTRHSYEIAYKYRYQCQSLFCKKIVGRHSNSIDTAKKVCGSCKGRLVLLGPDGVTPKKAKPLTEYQRFVQKHQGAVRKKVAAQDVMKVLGRMWQAEKEKTSGRKDKEATEVIVIDDDDDDDDENDGDNDILAISDRLSQVTVEIT